MLPRWLVLARRDINCALVQQRRRDRVAELNALRYIYEMPHGSHSGERLHHTMPVAVHNVGWLHSSIGKTLFQTARPK